ncbi:hypothetical protein GcC1_n018014 [Golovinomyces cichoracearum]|uniref:Uncharacterized protein n=1 Tax=Golovinomyces cichoracearum TaxID=62708 RepID=A0A420J5J9_9PEZI|nr:hypothetical protein GcC1_n018014 [Golovinomyces cichoracearum]
MKMSLGGVAAGRRCSTEKGPGVTYSMSNKQTFLIVIRRFSIPRSLHNFTHAFPSFFSLCNLPGTRQG